MKTASLLGIAWLLMAVPASAQQLAPRQPLPKVPLAESARMLWPDGVPPVQPCRLLVKFADELSVRATADGRLESRAGVDLSSVLAVVGPATPTFAPGIRIPETILAGLQSRAAARSGRAQPDLAGMVEARVASGSVADLIALGDALQSSSLVEFASLIVPAEPACVMPPTGDIPPFTPSVAFLQTYRSPNPGLDFDFAHSLGLLGDGVRLSDCEFGWTATHEDLAGKDLHLEPGQTIDPQVITLGNDDHGTAVMGVIASQVNGYGCSGMVPNANIYTYPVWTVQGGHREMEAVTNAIAQSAPGDVVLVELQFSTTLPVEITQAFWMVIRTAFDAGVVMVEAAGNGNKDLDGAGFAAYQSFGDSGAILVGAGSADGLHDKLSFSTFGSRVNVQAWGQNVFTLGYGDFAAYGADKNQRYTSKFNGTSSASCLVASACVALQQRARGLYGVPLGPESLRQLLVATGVPQGAGGHVGPCVNLSSALGELPVVWTDLGNALDGTAGAPSAAATGTLEADTPLALTLSNARPAAAAWLVIGFTAASAPFKGGMLVPFPKFVVGPFAVSGAGIATVAGTWPPDAPPGSEWLHQWWIDDPAGAQGFAASNALKATTP